MYLKLRQIILLFLILISVCSFAAPQSGFDVPMMWEQLPVLSENQIPALSGAFAGIHNDAVIVAGGCESNCLQPDWSANTKITVLDKNQDLFTGFDLAKPIAYGISVSTAQGVLCAGGSNGKQLSSDAFLMKWDSTGKSIIIEPIPNLPQPCAFGSAAVRGNTVYMIGSRSINPDSQLNAFYSLDMISTGSTLGYEWKKLADLPFDAGFLNAVASQHDGFDSCVYVIAGRDSSWVDVYKFSPLKNSSRSKDDSDSGNVWQKCKSLPYNKPVSSLNAVAYGDSHILVFCDDEVMLYHTITDTWTTAGPVSGKSALKNAFLDEDKVVTILEKDNTLNVAVLSLLRQKGLFGWINGTVLVSYLVFLSLVGFFYAKKEKSACDYFQGGKRIPWWAAGLSIFGTQLSAIAFMAIPAKVYASDWLYFGGVIAISLVQPIVIYLYLPFFRQLKVASAYEYLERRFNLFARMLACVSFILFQIGRMTIVLFLPALALSAVTGLNIYLCIVLMGVVVTFYTMAGGIEAVIWTDVLQVIVLVGAGITSLLIVVSNLEGGFSELWHISTADNKLKFVDLNWGFTTATIWVILLGGLFQNIISYTADQAVVQRYLVTKDIKAASNSIWANAFLVIPVSLIWFSIGTALYCFYKANPTELDPTVKTDQIFPLFVAQQLPVGVVGLVIAGLFAAAQSTISSSMNSISTVISTDFYARFSKNYNDKTSVKIAVLSSLVLGLLSTSIAIWMAANQGMIVSLWDVYIAVIGLLMAGVAGLFVLGIFTKRSNPFGAIVGVLCGVVVLYTVQRYTDIHFYIYSFIGIAASFIVGYAVSCILPSSQKSIDGLTIYTLKKVYE